MPETLDQLHEIVERGLGDPPPMSSIRGRYVRRRRRRMIPAASLVAASVVAVIAIAVARPSHHLSPTLGGHITSSPVRVDTSLTPPGWAAVDFGYAQLSVPGSWTVVLGQSFCYAAVRSAGAVELGSPISQGSPPPCTHTSRSSHTSWAMIEPFDPFDPTSRAITGRARYVNGIRVYQIADGSDVAYVVPSLAVKIELFGPDATRVIGTLTHSPRQVVLSNGPVAAPPTWKYVAFDGLSVQVPPADYVFPTTGSTYPIYTCSLLGTTALSSQVFRDIDATKTSPSGCPNFSESAASVFGQARTGVQIHARVDSAVTQDGFSDLGACFSVHSFKVCPYALPELDILAVRVSGNSLPHSLLVLIGLSGSGLDAERVLYSMRLDVHGEVAAS